MSRPSQHEPGCDCADLLITLALRSFVVSCTLCRAQSGFCSSASSQTATPRLPRTKLRLELPPRMVEVRPLTGRSALCISAVPPGPRVASETAARPALHHLRSRQPNRRLNMPTDVVDIVDIVQDSRVVSRAATVNGHTYSRPAETEQDLHLC